MGEQIDALQIDSVPGFFQQRPAKKRRKENSALSGIRGRGGTCGCAG